MYTLDLLVYPFQAEKKSSLHHCKVRYSWRDIFQLNSLKNTSSGLAQKNQKKCFICMYFFPVRSEDDYSEEEEEEEDDEEEEEYDGEIPQPELEPRSRRCLVGDAGICVIPRGNGNDGDEEEDEEDEDEEGEHDMHGEDSDSDGPVPHKDEDSDEDEEDEPPMSKHNKLIRRSFSGFSGLFVNLCSVAAPSQLTASLRLAFIQAHWPAG